MVPSVFLKLVTDVCLKETSTIQVHDKSSLRCQLEVDEVHARCDGSLIGGALYYNMNPTSGRRVKRPSGYPLHCTSSNVLSICRV